MEWVNTTIPENQLRPLRDQNLFAGSHKISIFIIVYVEINNLDISSTNYIVFLFDSFHIFIRQPFIFTLLQQR